MSDKLSQDEKAWLEELTHSLDLGPDMEKARPLEEVRESLKFAQADLHAFTHSIENLVRNAEKEWAKEEQPGVVRLFVDRILLDMQRSFIGLRPALFAISLFLAASVGYLLWPTTIVAPKGEIISETLPDGSIVHLNSSSSIAYNNLFRFAKRKVKLNGEAYFEVVKGNNTFQVSTFNAQVRVLGTKFNVRAWENDLQPETEVYLKEGRVAIYAKERDGQVVELAPGHVTRVIINREMVTSAMLEEERPSWRTGGFMFIDRQIGDILSELERRYATQISVKPASILNERYTLISKNPRELEDILQSISRGLGYRYQDTREGYEVYDPVVR